MEKKGNGTQQAPPPSPLMSSGSAIMRRRRERASTLTIGEKRPVRRKAKEGEEEEPPPAEPDNRTLSGEESGAQGRTATIPTADTAAAKEGATEGSPRDREQKNESDEKNESDTRGGQERNEAERAKENEAESPGPVETLAEEQREETRLIPAEGWASADNIVVGNHSSQVREVGTSTQDKPLSSPSERAEATRDHAEASRGTAEVGYATTPPAQRKTSRRIRGSGKRSGILVLDGEAINFWDQIQGHHYDIIRQEKEEEEKDTRSGVSKGDHDSEKRKDKDRANGEEHEKGKHIEAEKAEQQSKDRTDEDQHRQSQSEELTLLRTRVDELIATNMSLTTELQVRASTIEAMKKEVATAKAEQEEAIQASHALEQKLKTKLEELEAHTEKKLRSLLASLKSQ